MSESVNRPSVADLFVGFFTVGILGFGGVLPSARRLVVEQRRWMTPAEFTDLLGLCQFLPGGNIMNVSVALGARFQGVRGAVAAFLGLMTGPVIVVIAMGAIYDRFKDYPPVRGAFVFLSAAAAGFMLSTALRIAAPLRGKPLGIGVSVVTFVAIAVFGLPMPVALPVLGAGSIMLAWFFRP